jgi:hypothetical protein
MIWVNREAEYFSNWGWTPKSLDSLSGKSGAGNTCAAHLARRKKP